MQRICKYQSPFGGITMAGCDDGLTGLWFDGQKYFAEALPAGVEEGELPVFARAREWLDCYFSGRDPGFTPALHLEATPFRLAVWGILKEIPYGKVISYKDIAERIARKTGVARMSPQAVGGAVGHNPVSVIIPCHRVVGVNGSLTGYAGGIDRKMALLALEKVDTARLFVPLKGTAL